jgi:hypothetical protein
MESRGGMIATDENPDSSTRALWHSYKQSSNSNAGRTGEGSY